MNPREFCSEPGYSTAVFLTYNFDAVFFESVILRDLWQGQTEDILVVADRGQIETSLERWSGKLKYLGRKYQLLPSRVSSTFHPKVFLRIADNKARIAVGSGNVSFGGWGANQELATDWTVDLSGDQVSREVGAIARLVLESLPENIPHEAPRRRLNSLAVGGAESNWIGSSKNILMSWSGNTLADQLANRWEGKEFDEVTVFTGSSDEHGEMLRWAHNQFGVRQAIVIGNPSHLSFSPAKLAELPLEVSLHHPAVDKPMHAKAYVFTGSQGTSVVIGSANCSRAAWLLRPARGGNIETIVVWDEVESKGVSGILDVVGPKFSPEEESSAGDSTDDRNNPAVAVGIPEVHWEGSTDTLVIRFKDVSEKITSVGLLTSDGLESLQRLDTEGLLWQLAGDAILDSFATNFVTLNVEFESGEVIPVTTWVNDLGELRQASGGHRITNVLLSLSKSRDASEYRRILNDLAAVGQAILTERHLFADPTTGIDSRKDDRDETPELKPIDPDVFVQSLVDLEERENEHLRFFASTRGISLQSVLRAFFAASAPVEAEDSDLAEDADQDGVFPGRKTQKAKTEPTSEPSIESGPDDRTKTRIYKSVSGFFDQLSSSDFYDNCTATQLREAIAYPLCIAVRGRERGWFDEEVAADWAIRICNTLFSRKLPNKLDRGILSAVRERFLGEGKGSDFIRIVGDGTLWVVLLATLSRIRWTGKNGAFIKALALRAIYSSSDLLESTKAERVKRLLSFLDEEQANFVLRKTRRATMKIGELELHLKDNLKAIKSVQEAERVPFDAGDLLWSPGGWAEVIESGSWGENVSAYLHAKADKATIKTSFFVNMTKLSEADGEVQELITDVSQLVG